MIPIKVVSFDVGEVLGFCTGESLGAALARWSPRSGTDVSAAVARHLHSCSDITEGLLGTVAAELDLPVGVVREVVATPRPLQIVPHAAELIAALRRRFPELRVVVCSNVSPADAGQIATVREAMSGLVEEFVFSCEFGLAKPDPALFTTIEDRMGVAAEEIVHVGDRLEIDVEPALRAGWRALLVRGDHAEVPRLARARRYRSAADLTSAVGELERWIATSRAAVRPTLPVRASVRLRNEQGKLLIAKGPDDRWFHLIGGRLETFGPDHAAAAAARETQEELGIRVQIGELLWTGCSVGESSAGENKIHFVFGAALGEDAELHPDPAEVAELLWVTRAEAALVLHPREADRLDRIDRGETYGWQAD